MNAVLQKFRGLTEREQFLVITSGVVIVVAFIYWGIFAPLNNGIAAEKTRLASQQKLLEWVSDKANRAQQLRSAAGTAKAFRGSLAQAVNNTTNRFNIVISRMQPQDEELQVWIDQAPFNDVLAWLQAMETMGIVVLNADIAEADSAGLVKIRRLQLGKA